MTFNEPLRRYTRSEEDILRARLEAIRTIRHPAEKGRSAEIAVQRYIRSILPAEYGVATGFIAYHDNACVEERDCSSHDHPSYECRYNCGADKIDLSRQVDVIIYDALRFGPIVRLEGCDVFPLEAVLAYIEVKSTLYKKRSSHTKLRPIEEILQFSEEIRSQVVKLFHVPVHGTYTKSVLVPFPKKEVVPIRSFLFALDVTSSYRTPQSLIDGMEEARQAVGGFLSGAYVYGKGHFWSIPREANYEGNGPAFEIRADGKAALRRFKTDLYSSLSRFPRPPEQWTSAIDRYYDNDPAAPWVICVRSDPKSGTKGICYEPPEHWGESP